MAINQPDWNAVRAAVAAESSGETLYRRTVQTVYGEDGEAREVAGFEPVPQEARAKEAFARIETDVEQLIQELNSYRIIERDLRDALEADSGPAANIQRR